MFTPDQDPGICRGNTFYLFPEVFNGQRIACERGFSISFLTQNKIFGFKAGKAEAVFDGKNYQNFPYHNGQCACSFFTLVDVRNSKVSKDGHILGREYEIRFDTLLGYYLVQNYLSCYTDLIPGKFYLMSDYAQLFYRMLILPFYKNVKNPIGIDEIRITAYVPIEISAGLIVF